jgi:hypothetical protein
MTRTERTPEQRRRIALTIWALVGLAVFMFVTSIPFWKGLFKLAVGTE